MVAKAGALYFLVVFAAAFAVGALRTLVLAPWLGEMAALGVELPVILALSWWTAGRIAARCFVPARLAPRLAMGAVAFGWLMLAEFVLAVFAFGRPPAAYVRSFLTAPGLLGLAGQIAFALCPVLRISGRDRAKPSQ